MAKGLVLATVLIALWGAAVLATLHWARPRSIFKMMLTLFMPTVVAYAFWYWFTPPNLGMLPAQLSRTSFVLGFWNGLLFHVLLFLTAVQCFYHVNRSITLRLLTEFERAPDHFLTLRELSKVYRLEQMIQNRLEAMSQNHFIAERSGRYSLTRKGWVFATMCRAARAVLDLHEV